MKKIVLLLVFALLISSMSMSVFAIDDKNDTEPVDTATWVTVDGIIGGQIKFDSENGKILDANKNITQAHIPSMINGVEVVYIANNAFSDSASLTSLVVPGTVEKIVLGTFSHCNNLESVTLEEGVKEIGVSAFYEAKSLTSLSLPSSLEEIDNTAFGLCTSLKSVVIPEGVTEVGKMVFYGSSSMQSATLPLSLTEIGNDMFWQCSKFESVYYGGTADDWAAIDLDNDNKELLSATFYDLDGTEMLPTSAGSKGGWISVEGIEGGMILFDDSNGKILAVEEGITQAHIPSEINGVTVTYIDNKAFASSETLTSLIVPGTVKKIGLGSFSHCEELKTVTLEEGVEELGVSAFYNCEELTELSLPQSLKSIDNTAFGLNSALTEVTLPEGLVSLGNMTFYGSENLKTAYLPSTLNYMGEKIFWQCHDFTDIVYNGLEEDWNDIRISAINEKLYESTVTLSDGTTIEPEVSDKADRPSDWAKEELGEASGVGLVIILPGMPQYSDDMTREQFAEIVVNMVEISLGRELDVEPNKFTDTDSEAIAKAFGIGVVTGMTDTEFNPDGTVTREQIAAMLFRAAAYIVENGGNSSVIADYADLTAFSDSDEVSDWAKESVSALTASGIMQGTSNSTLSPQSHTTLEQGILLVYRLFLAA